MVIIIIASLNILFKHVAGLNGEEGHNILTGSALNKSESAHFMFQEQSFGLALCR